MPFHDSGLEDDGTAPETWGLEWNGIPSETHRRGEHRNLLRWPSNGVVASHDGQGRRLLQVSIERTNSELGLGFVVSDPVGKVLAMFVLDRAQVENVAAFMQLKVQLLKPSRGPEYTDFTKPTDPAKI
jgi:hypothetical protein